MKVTIKYGSIRRGATEFHAGNIIGIADSKLSRFGDQVEPVTDPVSPSPVAPTTPVEPIDPVIIDPVPVVEPAEPIPSDSESDEEKPTSKKGGK